MIMEDRLEREMKITINHKYDQTDPQTDPQTMTQTEVMVAQICPRDQITQAEIQIQMVMEIPEMTTIQIQAIPSVIW